jgi:formylglycine-generating enzyme required for sulfatase activity
MRVRKLGASVLAFACVACFIFSPAEGRGPCPSGMAYVDAEPAHPYCIDRWEATVVELHGGDESPHTATHPVTHLDVKAVSRAGVKPQGYISKIEAEAACKNARKRLCTGEEWERACRGRKPTTFPYGDEHKAGYCNDSGTAPVVAYDELNDPRINEAPNTVAPTGSFSHCRNGYGVYDMVGNLHEWTADVHAGAGGAGGTLGVFRGGYYQEAHKNGEGCAYKTVVHAVDYHDYSTGFRCCSAPK